MIVNFTECSVWSELWDSTGLKETGERAAAVFFLTARIWSRALNAGAVTAERKVMWGEKGHKCSVHKQTQVLHLHIDMLKCYRIHLATKRG